MAIKNGVGITSLLNGSMVKKALSAANETVAKGVYDATTLSGVDADLVVGNIKGGVTIFGKLGTLSITPAEDTSGSTVSAIQTSATGGWKKSQAVGAGADIDPIATKTLTFDANSLAFAAGFIYGNATEANTFKARLYMDGVLEAESGFLPLTGVSTWVIGFKALSGAGKICKITVHNYGGASDIRMYGGGATGLPIAGGIAVGSVKA